MKEDVREMDVPEKDVGEEEFSHDVTNGIAFVENSLVETMMTLYDFACIYVVYIYIFTYNMIQ